MCAKNVRIRVGREKGVKSVIPVTVIANSVTATLQTAQFAIVLKSEEI